MSFGLLSDCSCILTEVFFVFITAAITISNDTPTSDAASNWMYKGHNGDTVVYIPDDEKLEKIKNTKEDIVSFNMPPFTFLVYL